LWFIGKNSLTPERSDGAAIGSASFSGSGSLSDSSLGKLRKLGSVTEETILRRIGLIFSVGSVAAACVTGAKRNKYNEKEWIEIPAIPFLFKFLIFCLHFIGFIDALHPTETW
jgi:hypothetical protein